MSMTCDECGTELIDECLRCGAPQCCPKCCAETTQEIIKALLCPDCKAPLCRTGDDELYCDNCEAIVEDANLEMGIAPGLEDVGCK